MTKKKNDELLELTIQLHNDILALKKLDKIINLEFKRINELLEMKDEHWLNPSMFLKN